jgi:ACR3 family arsenite transporter
MELFRVNLPVAVLIWLMILPMLLKIDFRSLQEVRQHWKGVGVTLFVNWAVKPFSMALLAWLFIRHLFAPWLPAGQLDSYHCRSDPAGGRTVHGHGVRVE